MAERVDHQLLFQILRGLQARVAFLEAMLGEIRDGFAAIRSQRVAARDEAIELERRVAALEASLERLRHRLQRFEP